jgi:hypothetical protein
LYRFSSIDNRYPLFDTPAVFRMILNDYIPNVIDNDYLVLEKRDTAYLTTMKSISLANAKIGESVPIPKIDGEFIFAKIYMEYNFLGKILNILYKTPDAKMKLYSNGYEYEHKFIFSTARNGIFLSQYIHNVKELEKLWNGKPVNNVSNFMISVENEHFYNKNIRVEFFKVTPNKISS